VLPQTEGRNPTLQVVDPATRIDHAAYMHGRAASRNHLPASNPTNTLARTWPIAPQQAEVTPARRETPFPG